MPDVNEKLLPPGASKDDYQKNEDGSLKVKDGKLVKKRKAQAKRVPEGHKLIKFYLPGEDHDALTRLAEDEDRSPEDYARVATRRAARSHESHPKHPSKTANTGSQNL